MSNEIMYESFIYLSIYLPIKKRSFSSPCMFWSPFIACCQLLSNNFIFFQPKTRSLCSRETSYNFKINLVFPPSRSALEEPLIFPCFWPKAPFLFCVGNSCKSRLRKGRKEANSWQKRFQGFQTVSPMQHSMSPSAPSCLPHPIII